MKTKDEKLVSPLLKQQVIRILMNDIGQKDYLYNFIRSFWYY